MDASYFKESWETSCFGGFLFAKEDIKTFLKEKTAGTLIFTGASASLRGKSNFGAFNSAKGALRNLAQAIAKEYAEYGIHVGHVIVDGGLAGERIKQRLSDFDLTGKVALVTGGNGGIGLAMAKALGEA